MGPRLLAALLLQPHPGYPIHDDAHDHHECIAMVRGTYRARSGGRDLRLGPGGVVLYPAGAHHMVQRGGDPVTFFCLQWEGEPPGDRTRRVHDPTQRLVMAARWLHDLSLRPERDRRAEAGLLEAIVAEVRAVDRGDDDGGDGIETIRRVLATNYSRVQSMDNLATIAGLSPSQLTRQFQERFGCTPMAYLRSVRIEAALARISLRQFSMQEIAEACGFGRASYLTRVIRQHTGRTPSQIRRGRPDPRALER